MSPRSETLIAEIAAAFEAVERGNGVSIHETREIDYHSSRARRLAARARDNERSWQEVPPEALSSNDKYLAFLDAEGMRYYLPALMIWHLKSDEQIRGEELLYALCTFSPATAVDRQFRLLNERQSRAVLAFLRHVGQSGCEYQELVENACEIYWGRFDDHGT